MDRIACVVIDLSLVTRHSAHWVSYKAVPFLVPISTLIFLHSRPISCAYQHIDFPAQQTHFLCLSAHWFSCKAVPFLVLISSNVECTTNTLSASLQAQPDAVAFAQ